MTDSVSRRSDPPLASFRSASKSTPSPAIQLLHCVRSFSILRQFSLRLLRRCLPFQFLMGRALSKNDKFFLVVGASQSTAVFALAATVDGGEVGGIIHGLI